MERQKCPQNNHGSTKKKSVKQSQGVGSLGDGRSQGDTQEMMEEEEEIQKPKSVVAVTCALKKNMYM